MKFKAIISLLWISLSLPAQEMYSFISDKRFPEPSDLVGYHFVPNHKEYPGEVGEDLAPGEYSFGVTANNLYVHGEGISGVYSLNNINGTEYGYKLLLMNARDPRIQGHLKVILNQYDQVDALVFKRSNLDKEIIFYQAGIPKNINEVEEEYFTDKWETSVETLDSLWGMTIYPFFRVHLRDKVQERLNEKDSTYINFIERVTTIDKTKYKKKSKKDLENIEAGPEEVSLDGEEQNTEEMQVDNENAIDEEKDGVKKKIKIIKEYFVEINSILNYKDGGHENKKWTYQIKEIQELEDTQAGPDEDRFQIAIKTTKGEDIYLHLTNKRTISSIEVEGLRYLMRGH